MVKQKSPGGRTYDKDGYKRRAGCLCFKDENEREILLVSSSGEPGRWVVPAGCIEAGEEIKTAAVREVYEEACVVGKTKNFIGLFQNDKAKSRTYIYSMIVKEEIDMNLVPLPLYEKRKQRRWFTIEDAITTLMHRPVQQTYITSALQKQSRAKTNQVINNTHIPSMPQTKFSQACCKPPAVSDINRAVCDVNTPSVLTNNRAAPYHNRLVGLSQSRGVSPENMNFAVGSCNTEVPCLKNLSISSNKVAPPR